jgi:hypothetical protein
LKKIWNPLCPPRSSVILVGNRVGTIGGRGGGINV